MERASLIRWGLIGVAVFLFMKYGWPLVSGDTGGSVALQPLNLVEDRSPADRVEESVCKIAGTRFNAELSTKGAVLKHAFMTDEKYARFEDHKPTGEPIDLVTTTLERLMPLRTSFRVPCRKDGDKCTQLQNTDQVAYDDFDWTLKSSTAKSCTFAYEDERVTITKTIAATERAFELSVAIAITNKDTEAQSHRLTIEQSDYHSKEKTAGSLGRASEFTTKVAARAGEETERKEQGDFEPDDFDGEEFTEEKWLKVGGATQWVAVSNSYFSKALFPKSGAESPSSELLVEHFWDNEKFGKADKDPNQGYAYRARLNYPVHALEPGKSAAYDVVVYVGPKEREVLASTAGGGVEAVELLDLGVFGLIGKLLIRYLYLLYGFTKTWGWAICLLTITVKLLLFPLSITQIKSSMAMRKLKPEMDALNAKYKDDAAQRGVALQELWRKNNVTNPMLGCLPVMFQMPVWFALYTALQTAVELYHTPFGPFIPDLSAPGLYYIVPAALGLSSLLQQHLMPMQGDAMQQKMMKWMMPAMFTVFMLFLPAGLGIYFLTNTWLGIGQQLAVERYYKSQTPTEDDKDDNAEEKGKDPSTKAKKKGSSSAKRAKA